MKILRVVAAVLCACVALFAVDTKYWSQSEMADFEKGTLSKIAVSSEGHLSLAPKLTEIFDASVTYLWAVARDFALKRYFDMNKLALQAVAPGRDGRPRTGAARSQCDGRRVRV